MSELRDAAARLVGKVAAQTLAHSKGLTQSPDELRRAWYEIRGLGDRLMSELERYEPLLACVDTFAALKGGWTGDEQASDAARKLLEALDRFAAAAPTSQPAAPPPSWSRAGDVKPPTAGDAQLPLGDREDPPSGSP